MYLRITRGRFPTDQRDAMLAAVPAVLAALRQLPGCQDARAGSDGSAGTSISVSTFDTLAHAQFARETVGESLTRLQAVGWQGDAPEFYEVAE